MAVKTFGDLLQETYRYFYVNYQNGEADESTVIPLSLMKTFINDTGRETTVGFGTKWKFREGSMPFYHVVNYQNLYLSGTSIGGVGVNISGNLNAPEFLNVGSNPTNYLINYPNYAGIPFIGQSGSTNYTGTSVGGQVVTTQFTGLGFGYELNNDVSHIEGIFIDNKGFLGMGQMQRRMMALPQQIVQITGTPSTYYEHPGLSANGNLMITFDMQPGTDLTTSSFLYLYEQKFQNLVNDSDVQTLIPEECQNILIFGALEKAYAFRQNKMSEVFKKQKEDLMWEMIRNSEKYTNYTVSWFPGDLYQGWNSYPYGQGGINTGYFY